MKFVYIINLCREIVANYSRTSLQLSHSSEIGQSKFTVQNSICSNTFSVNNRDKTVHQQAAPQTLYHYENMPMQYTEMFLVVVKNSKISSFFMFYLFLLKTGIDCGYMLA